MPMSVVRIQVKQKLMLERQIERGGQFILACDLCGKQGPTDLHELLIERDDVKGEEMVAKVTEAPENLMLLCHAPCHIPMAKMNQWRDFLISKQIDRYGRLALNKNGHSAKGLTPQQRNLRIVRMGEEVLSEWVLSLGMADPKPYWRRIGWVADDMLRPPVTVKEIENV